MLLETKLLSDAGNAVTELMNRSVARGAPTSLPEAVRYTRTRSMPVDMDRLRDERRLVDGIDDPAANAFKMLRTQVLFWLADRGGSCVGVTSPGRGEGKTTTAVNLAVQLAAELDYTVLLVDANLRSPGVHEYFGWPPVRGLSDYLAGSAPLEELLLHPTQIGRLVVLPAGAPLLNSSEMLGSRAMGNLVGELKTRYPRRIVVFDMPAMLDSTDALAFSKHVDGLVMVAAQRKTHKRDLVRAQSMIDIEKLVGLTLNRARP